MALTVRPYSHELRSQWDEFVFAHPHGSPFHLIAWKDSIESTFRYRPMYLAAMEGRTIRGVLPLFFVRNLLMGKALISSPFAVYGGALADSEESRVALRDEVSALAQSLRVKHVELRNGHPGQSLGFSGVSRYVTFTQRVSADEEAILASIPRKTRYMVRKGLKQGFTTRTQTEDFAAFEALYSANLRRLGTPSFPRKHFANLLRNFRGMIDIRETMLGERVVSAVLTFYFRDQALPYYGASDPSYNAQAPNDFMYFDLMRWAGQSGYSTYDFGRSKKESGSFDFKAHWGMETRELPYEMLLVRRSELPNFSPKNPRFRLAIRLWQYLPLPVTRALGPQLVRLVP